MKSALFLTTLAFIHLASIHSHAQLTSPLFLDSSATGAPSGGWTWSADYSYENGDLRYDVYIIPYTDSGGGEHTATMTVNGRIDYPHLAIVSGAPPPSYDGDNNPITESFDGHIYRADSTAPWSYGENHYSWTYEPGEYPEWNPRSPAFSSGGTTWYNNSATGTTTINLYVSPPTRVNSYSRGYVSHEFGSSYSSEVTISNSNGTLPYGLISGSAHGFYHNGVFHIDGFQTYSSPASSITSIPFFGATLPFSQSQHYITHTWENGQVTAATTSEEDTYQGDDGSATIYGQAGSSTRTITAWHAHGGSLSGTVTGGTFTWSSRSAPLLASAQLTLTLGESEGQLLSWSGPDSTVNHATGAVTDHYSITGGPQVHITGTPKNYREGSSTATVVISGLPGGPVEGALAFTSGFALPGGITIEDAVPISSAQPTLVSAASLWVGLTRYDFHQAFASGSHRRDVYRNTVGGTLVIAGAPGTGNAKSVWLSQGPQSGSYTYVDTDGTGENYAWQFSGIDIRTEEPPGPAPAFWVSGTLYQPAPEGDPSLFLPPQEINRALLITADYPGHFTLTLQDTATQQPLATGSWSASQPGLFHLQTTEAPPLPAYAAAADGTPFSDVLEFTLNLPPALELLTGVATSTNGLFHYLGTYSDGIGGSYAVYAAAGCHSLIHISLESVPQRPVLLEDCHTGVLKAGIYHEASRLFQALAPSESTGSLPMPLYAVHDSSQNHILWDLPRPSHHSDARPDTFIVRGEVWRFSHMDGADAIYLGYLSGSQLSVGGLVNDQRLVTLTQPGGTTSTGYLDMRGSARLRNGTLVFSGDYHGERILPTGVQTENLHTIAGDLDLTGNVLTLGSLANDIGVAGATLQFEDWLPPGENSAHVATLHFSLNRPSAQWLWWKAGPTPASAPEPMMKLDTQNRLSLRDPADPDGLAGVMLDPSPTGTTIYRGSIHVQGVLRVLPSGDLPMAPEYQNGPKP